MCDQQSLRSACAYAQSDQSLCYSLEYSMIVKLLTEHNLEFLSLKGGCRGSSESTLVKMSNCWKFHVSAHIVFLSLKVIFICHNSADPTRCVILQQFIWTSTLSTFQERVDLTIYKLLILKLSLYATNYNVLLLTLQLNYHKSYLTFSGVDRF